MNKEERRKRVDEYYTADGESKRYDYPLTKDSVVLDIGGFKGDFATKINELYKPVIFIFEPVADYFRGLQKLFVSSANVIVMGIGLGSKTESKMISVLGDASSTLNILNNINDSEMIQMVDVVEILGSLIISYDKIDLMKINIEGGEYELLPHLIDNGLLSKVENIQVQFHDYIPGYTIPGAREQMEVIQASLLQTHKVTWQFEFVWENWKLRG